MPSPLHAGCLTRMRIFILALLLASPLPSSRSYADELPTQPDAVLKVGGGTLDVYFGPGTLHLSHADVLHWIVTAAQAVSHYYGHFPVPHVAILVSPREGLRSASGTTYGGHGDAFIRITIGSAAAPIDLKDNWVMTHEMVHLAFPQVADNQHWIEEGLATYVEPVARAQIGDMPATEVWQEAVEGMPKGEPATGDRGLDHTPTWGRTYWGGAMFCLLADVEIRERTHDRYGLQDALRGILKSDGSIETSSTLKSAFEAGDEAVGVPVLMELYRKMKDMPAPVDLEALWKKLGIVYHRSQISFDDLAPDALIRQSITDASSR